MKCENGKWKWGRNGECRYASKESCERANAGNREDESMDEDGRALVEKLMESERMELGASAELRQDDEHPRRIRFRASDQTVDRHGTIVRPMGLDTKNFKRNPVFIWAHDAYGSFFGGGPQMESIIGRVAEFHKDEDSFDIDVDFVEGDVNPKGEMAFQLVKGKFLNAVSIGFIPRKIELEVQEDTETEVPVILKAELLEVSLVPIPSNPSALAISRSMFAADFDANPDIYSKAIMPSMTRVLGENAGVRKEWQELLNTCGTQAAVQRMGEITRDHIEIHERDCSCGKQKATMATLLEWIETNHNGVADALVAHMEKRVSAPPADEAADSGASVATAKSIERLFSIARIRERFSR